MLHIGPIAPTVNGHRHAVVRMVAQRLGGGPLRRLGDQVDRPVEADGQHVIAVGQRFIGALVFHIGAEAADPSGDRFAAIGMGADLARQTEQPQGGFQGDLGRHHALGQ